MPTKSLKSKPRTNWKLRFEQAEVQADYWSTRADILERAIVRAQAEKSQAIERAESAEKHNALLLEERQRHENVLVNQSLDNFTVASNSAHATATITKPIYWDGTRIPMSDPSLDAGFGPDGQRAKTPATHWQRFKSWLSRRGK